jgi:Fe-Mn family superoxide dismutase
MSITFNPLPYPQDALSPHISAETLSFHHGKHLAKYVETTNALIADTAFAEKDLKEIISYSEGPLFNNAAQVFNHDFYFQCLSPTGGGAPSGQIATAIQNAFGSYEEFRKQFANAAATQFGSGWAWLVLDCDNLMIMKTSNADTPVAKGLKPLLTIDVWEHAYYIDYRNARPAYIDTFLDHLVNWDFVNGLITEG